MTRPRFLVGIDPGVTTGVAVWDREADDFVSIASATAIAAMAQVAKYEPGIVEVWFEDARLRTWFGGADARQKRSGAGIREGVGSVKRDSSLWQEFCEHYGFAYRAVKPAPGATKWNAERFKRITGWDGRTSNHARDAAALVFKG